MKPAPLSWMMLAAVAYSGFAPAAAPAASPDTEKVRAELVSEVVSIRPGHSFWVAVRLDMTDGWHVNWINPGDAGLAPTVDWTLPGGFETSDIQWPYPERFTLPELSIFGYEKSVLLMVEIRPPGAFAAGRVTLEARVDWLACREACIPGEATVRLELPVGPVPPARDAKWAPEFAATRLGIPKVSSTWRFSARLTDEHIIINAVPPAGTVARIEEMTFYPTAQGVIENAVEQELKQTANGYKLDIARARLSAGKPTRITGVLVSREGWGHDAQKALEIDVPVE
jgi:thiol:disulfide interchange protein DsbD